MARGNRFVQWMEKQGIPIPAGDMAPTLVEQPAPQHRGTRLGHAIEVMGDTARQAGYALSQLNATLAAKVEEVTMVAPTTAEAEAPAPSVSVAPWDGRWVDLKNLTEERRAEFLRSLQGRGMTDAAKKSVLFVLRIHRKDLLPLMEGL